MYLSLIVEEAQLFVLVPLAIAAELFFLNGRMNDDDWIHSTDSDPKTVPYCTYLLKTTLGPCYDVDYSTSTSTVLVQSHHHHSHASGLQSGTRYP